MRRPFILHLILGRKTDLFCVKKFFLFIILKFPAPPFPKSCLRYTDSEYNKRIEGFEEITDFNSSFLALVIGVLLKVMYN